MSRAVVVGAGIIGAACAYYLSRAGLPVTVLDAGPIAGGTSSRGEGNLLLSDKLPGPELALALHSRTLWQEFAAEVGEASIEYESKGGLMVAATEPGRQRLSELVAEQQAAGVEAALLTGDQLPGYEPRLADRLTGGAFYPQDAQLQPVLATARLLQASGAQLRPHTPVRSVETTGDRVTGVRVAGEVVPAAVVVNATGLAGGEFAVIAGGARLPISPRRGFILVTEPLAGPGDPPPIRRKVYAAEYVGDVASDDAGLASSAVIEGTRAGTVLIGSSRERGGFDEAYPLPVLRRIAAQAVALFPFLAGVRVLRAYHGFRPYSPDHLPVIGPDPALSGLWHACGHEGAGIGLATGTGAMIAAMVSGAGPAVEPAPFAPARFTT